MSWPSRRGIVPWGRSLPEICLTQELANVLQDTSRGSEACGLRWGYHLRCRPVGDFICDLSRCVVSRAVVEAQDHGVCDVGVGAGEKVRGRGDGRGGAVVERTTSTPRFLATAMTVLTVPRSTPVDEQTHQHPDHHYGQQQARGGLGCSNLPTTLILAVCWVVGGVGGG